MSVYVCVCVCLFVRLYVCVCPAPPAPVSVSVSVVRSLSPDAEEDIYYGPDLIDGQYLGDASTEGSTWFNQADQIVDGTKGFVSTVAVRFDTLPGENAQVMIHVVQPVSGSGHYLIVSSYTIPIVSPALGYQNWSIPAMSLPVFSHQSVAIYFGSAGSSHAGGSVSIVNGTSTTGGTCKYGGQGKDGETDEFSCTEHSTHAIAFAFTVGVNR